MLYLVGNGPSRQNVDLESLPEWWGFNMIYTTHTPDIVFCGDVYPQHEIIKSGYYKTNKVSVGEWNELPIEAMDMMMMGVDLPIEVYRDEECNSFVAQSELTTGQQDGKFYFTGYNNQYSENIITYPHPTFKNLLSGMYALGYAVHHGYEKICLVGYDSLQFDELNNVFEGQHNYRDNYGSVQAVGDVQKAQFVALLEYINKEYPKVEVFFKNPIDGFDKIEYNNIISRFNIEDRWVLGLGLESEL